MLIFLELLKLLKQDVLIVTCDYGVYHLARHIQLEDSDKFKKLIFIVVGFHTAKIVEACAGKLLDGSCPKDIFIQKRIFGDIMVEQVLSGSHYVTSAKGFTYLYKHS